MAKGRKKGKYSEVAWNEATGAFEYRDDSDLDYRKGPTPGYDIPEEHIRPEQPSGFSGPVGEDNVLSRVRKEDERKLYGKRKLYESKEASELRSRSIFVESWSYHSLFPSMRTWAPLFAMIIAPYVLLVLGFPITGGNKAAFGALLPAAFALLVATGILSTYKMSVGHAVKDTLIHGLVLVSVALVYPWEGGPDGFVNVAAIYLVSHIVAHGIDFHLERADGRGWKLLVLSGFCTLALVAIGYGMFGLNKTSVLS